MSQFKVTGVTDASIPFVDLSAGQYRLYFSSTNTSFAVKDSAGTVTYLAGLSIENMEDTLGAAFQNSATITMTYNDGANTFSWGVNNASITTAMLAFDPATQAELDAALATKADDSLVVHKAGTETITGTKTFDGAAGIQFTPQASPTWPANSLVVNSVTGSLEFRNSNGNVLLQIGEEGRARARNVTGSTIPNGSAVYLAGWDATNDCPTIALAQGNSVATSQVIGITTEAFANNYVGYVTFDGIIHGLNTAGFTAGQTLWLSGTAAGGLTNVLPLASNARVKVGVCGFSNASTGQITVQIGTLLTEATIFSSSLKAAGAVGDGTTNDRPAFVTLDAALGTNDGILLTTGRYLVGTNLTITKTLAFDSGARIVVPTGVTITINAPIKAGIEQIFELQGTGSVVCNSYYVADRYVEWWGGTFNADCAIPFAQALKPGTRTLLQGRDYNTTATVAIPAYATLQGVSCHWENDNTATRVLVISPSLTLCTLGTINVSPPDLNSAPDSPAVFDVLFARNQAPNAGSIGVYVAWSRNARAERVRSTNSIIAWKVKSAISPFMDDCFAKRDTAIAAGQGADSWVGYDIDGTGALPAAGGNASVWLTRPQAELNVPAITNAVAFNLYGRISDTFITQPETVGCAYGLDILGDKAGSPVVGSNTNVTITNPVFDQSTVAAIRVQNINQWGSVKILDPYCGPAALDGILVSNCDGHVGIESGQIRQNVATAGKPVQFLNCKNPTLMGTSIAESTLAAVTLTNVTGGVIQPLVQNVTATCAAAVNSTAGVTNTTIRPSVNGGASKVTAGHKSDATSNLNNVISLVGAVPGVLVNKTVYVTGVEVGSTFPESDTQIGRATAAQVITSTVAINITGLAVTLEANSTYHIECLINLSAVSGTTPGMNLGVTGPASPTSVMLKRRHMNAATTEGAIGIVTAFGGLFGALLPVVNTVNEVFGTVSTGAAGGVLQLQATMTGTTPSTTVQAGSHIIAQRIAVTA